LQAVIKGDSGIPSLARAADYIIIHIRARPHATIAQNAGTVIDGDGEQSGRVYSEHRRGYLINGKLLRPARVAVLK